MEFPTTLSAFACAATADGIFVTGGSNGETDPQTGAFPTCSAETYMVSLPLPLDTSSDPKDTWRSVAKLSNARVNHACCVLKDGGGVEKAVVVSGGIDDAQNALSSIEILQLGDLHNGWRAGPVMPFARKSHQMTSVGGCLFIFGGKTEDPSRAHESHLFSFRHEVWMEGPSLPKAIRAGGLAIVFDRYAVLAGGIHGASDVVNDTWVLDLQPWVDWCENKIGAVHERPEQSGWFRGPDFPDPVVWPNLCTAAAKTGRADEWILSVSANGVGNTCYGICLTPSDLDRDPKDLWSCLGWQSLGATPECMQLGRSVVADGTLFMICGEHCNTLEASSTIHFRPLLSKGPVPIRGISDFEEGCSLQSILDHRIAINDLYPMGRLGLPIEEDLLYAPDGTKKLTLIPPVRDTKLVNRHCRCCLLLTHSLEEACDNSATQFGLRADSTVPRIPLCSACLCELLDD